jgi:radical SAM superfamily enzyme YgiQ (UPF0313 family)
MRALLIATYELGRQPYGLASPAAWLRRAGWDVVCVDVTREKLPRGAVEQADFVGFHLPMHTATRLAGPIIREVREINRAARLCAYGLYAPLNGGWLRSLGVNAIFGGEFEEALTRYATKGEPSIGDRAVPRITYLVPDRSSLPPLARYATLDTGDGRQKVVGSTDASRGCKHLCRHCPVVPIYGGRFRAVPPEVVLADIAAQVAAGAEHITFGDPDFFNGATHAMRVVDALHAAHPHVTYDVTIKVEHLLRHRNLLGRLSASGCAFVTSAVESIDDRVLTILDKGHTREDFVEAVSACREATLTFVPTFVAFHPWLTLDGYCDLLDLIDRLDLIDHVAPIQLAIRLLVPRGSRLLDLDEVRAKVAPFDPATLAYPWIHDDPRVDDLQREIAHLVGVRVAADRRAMFDEIAAIAYRRAGRPPRTAALRRPRSPVPRLSEPWYCCAEPNPDHLTLV